MQSENIGKRITKTIFNNEMDYLLFHINNFTYSTKY